MKRRAIAPEADRELVRIARRNDAATVAAVIRRLPALSLPPTPDVLAAREADDEKFRDRAARRAAASWLEWHEGGTA